MRRRIAAPRRGGLRHKAGARHGRWRPDHKPHRRRVSAARQNTPARLITVARVIVRRRRLIVAIRAAMRHIDVAMVGVGRAQARSAQHARGGSQQPQNEQRDADPGSADRRPHNVHDRPYRPEAGAATLRLGPATSPEVVRPRRSRPLVKPPARRPGPLRIHSRTLSRHAAPHRGPRHPGPASARRRECSIRRCEMRTSR